MASLVLVYHDPGLEEGHSIARRVAQLAASMSGVKTWRAVPISLVEEGEHGFTEGDLVAALLPFRGGHWTTVREEALKAGATPVRIPVEAATAPAALRLAPLCNGKSEVTVLYWPAKRFVEEQRRDLETLAGLVEEATGCRAVLLSIKEKRCGDLTLSTSMLPGRLTRFVRDECGGRGIGYLLEPEDAVWAAAAWAAGAAQAVLSEGYA